MKKQQEPFTSNIKEVIADRYEILWNKAIEKGDLKTAATVLKQETDMFGLNIEKQEVTVKDVDFKIEFD